MSPTLGRFVLKMIFRPSARTTPSATARKRCRSALPLARAPRTAPFWSTPTTMMPKASTGTSISSRVGATRITSCSS